MNSPESTQSIPLSGASPKSVKVDQTGGTGMSIEWRDGHTSHYPFAWLREACPCALCEEERSKDGRDPGQAAQPAPGMLPMFKPAIKPTEVAGVGRYAIRFSWNDGHQHGIYSWDFLRQWCPCEQCNQRRKQETEVAGS